MKLLLGLLWAAVAIHLNIKTLRLFLSPNSGAGMKAFLHAWKWQWLGLPCAITSGYLLGDVLAS